MQKTQRNNKKMVNSKCENKVIWQIYDFKGINFICAQNEIENAFLEVLEVNLWFQRVQGQNIIWKSFGQKFNFGTFEG